MLLNYDGFSRFTWTPYLYRQQNSYTIACFERFLADKRLSSTSLAIETVRSDDEEGFKGGDGEFTTAGSVNSIG